MKNIDKNIYIAALGGYLAVTLIMGVLFSNGGSFVDAMLMIFGMTLIPFILAFLVVAQLMVPSINRSITPMQAIRRGIGASLLIVAVVAAGFGICDIIYQNLFPTNSGIASLADRVLSSLGYLAIYVYVGVAWGAIPAIIFGGGLGWCIYRKKQKAGLHQTGEK